jgi:hypothetical protein
MKQATIQQPLMGNCFANRQERKNSMVANALQQRSGLFHAVSADLL